MWHNLLWPNTLSVVLQAAAAWHRAILTQVSAPGMDSFPRVKLYTFHESVLQGPGLLLSSPDMLWDKKTGIIKLS